MRPVDASTLREEDATCSWRKSRPERAAGFPAVQGISSLVPYCTPGPPGGTPRLYGRQDARRYGGGIKKDAPVGRLIL